MEDDALWKMAQREEHLFITTDKGFTQYRRAPHYGVLVIGLRRPNRRRIHRVSSPLLVELRDRVHQRGPAGLDLLDGPLQGRRDLQNQAVGH